MIFDHAIETRDTAEQYLDDAIAFQKQMQYLMRNSAFYKQKLASVGLTDIADIPSLDKIHTLPFTEKDELRKSQADHPPFGSHLACSEESLRRVFSTSGTTGVPCYLGLTTNDLEMYATNVARGYTAAGFRAGQKIVVGFNAGPFVAGAVYYGFDKIGCSVIPVGTGNTERMVTAIQKLGGTGISCTPSYALYLIEWCVAHNIDPMSLGIKNIITAGEPGGGDPMIRNQIESALGCKVRESMGIGDISLSVWAEDDDANGMNFMARGYVHVELINPISGNPIPWEDGAEGELVYTALQREAMPLLRFRSRDHVVVNMKPNPTGRTGPRIRCVGRTDDMLIVRGVNLFPTAVRNVLDSHLNNITGMFTIRPNKRGVQQDPPLPIDIEVNNDKDLNNSLLAGAIAAEIKERLLVTCKINLVSKGTIPRETYKSKLVDYSHLNTKAAS